MVVWSRITVVATIIQDDIMTRPTDQSMLLRDTILPKKEICRTGTEKHDELFYASKTILATV